ncbi:MAG: hypothetical protein V1904_13190 [Bacteroidota bacterium]
MKTLKFTRILIACMLVSGITFIVHSQNCNMYYSLTNGNEYEMTNYDSNDKINGKTINKISDVVTTTEGSMATVQTTSKDEKDEVVATANSSVKCVGDKMYIEMKSFIPSQSMAQMQNMDIKSDASWMDIPQNLSVGMSLDDATGTISLYSNGTLITTMKITITNRKVASKESVTTTAGTFDCYKITQDFQMETTTMGISVPVSIKGVEYYSAGTGSVKTETYDKNGKLMGYSLLTKITKL